MPLLQPIVPVSDNGSLLSFDMGERAYHLAVSGDVFRWMVDYGSHETLQRVSCRHMERIIQLRALLHNSC